MDDEIIEELTERLDGIIGWLTFFGYNYTTDERNPERIYESAAKLSVEELNKALSIFGEVRAKYFEALRIMATLGSARRSEIKRGVEAKLGKSTTKNFLKCSRTS